MESQPTRIAFFSDSFSAQSVPIQTISQMIGVSRMVIVCSPQFTNEFSLNESNGVIPTYKWYRLDQLNSELKQVDLFHAHHTKGKLYAFLLSYLYRKPLVISMHNPLDNISKIHSLINKIISKKCIKIVNNSESTSDSYTNPILLAKKIVIYNGVDTPRHGTSRHILEKRIDRFHRRQINLVILGRLVPFKRVNIIIKALEKYAELFSSWTFTLTIIGSGSEESALKKQVSGISLDHLKYNSQASFPVGGNGTSCKFGLLLELFDS